MCSLMGIGLAISAVGQVAQGMMAARAANEQAAAVREQKEHEKALYATREVRARKEFRAATARQTAEIANAGVQLDSPSALVLARDAAAEQSFEAQSIRSFGVAKDAELTATERSYRAQASQAMLGGVFGALGTVFKGVPSLLS